MKEESPLEATRELAKNSHLGIMFPVAIGLGFFVGYQADRWLGTSPWLALAGFFLGMIAAIRSLLQAVTREEGSQADRVIGPEPDDDRQGRSH